MHINPRPPVEAGKTFPLTLLLLMLLLLCFSVTALAQSTATIKGTVTDSGGAVVPNAKVLIHNVGTGVDRTTQTDANGDYLVSALPVGNYRVEIQAPGLQRQIIDKIELEVARTVPINAQLKVSGATESVTITGEAPVLETTTQSQFHGEWHQPQ
jgi:hypothetical protein